MILNRLRWAYDLTGATHLLAHMHGERVRLWGICIGQRWVLGVLRTEKVAEPEAVESTP